MTLSPEAWMNVGPELPLIGQAKDVRLEFAVIYDNYEPTDLGKCGEGLTFSVVCALSLGSYAHGLTGLAIAGRVDPYENYSGIKRWDYGVRLEGRFDRFTFAITDFWGWDDGFYLDLVNQYGRQVDSATGAGASFAAGSSSDVGTSVVAHSSAARSSAGTATSAASVAGSASWAGRAGEIDIAAAKMTASVAVVGVFFVDSHSSSVHVSGVVTAGESRGRRAPHRC